MALHHLIYEDSDQVIVTYNIKVIFINVDSYNYILTENCCPLFLFIPTFLLRFSFSLLNSVVADIVKTVKT